MRLGLQIFWHKYFKYPSKGAVDFEVVKELLSEPSEHPHVRVIGHIRLHLCWFDRSIFEYFHSLFSDRAALFICIANLFSCLNWTEYFNICYERVRETCEFIAFLTIDRVKEENWER